MHRSQLLLSCAIGAIAIGHGQALAAETADQGATIEEVIVTAEKRAVSLQDVPIAISAFTSETRDLIGIESVQDMTNFTPGLTYSTSSDRASLRGIGRLTNNLASEPGVANYVDGVYTQSTFEIGRSQMFVDRVEVLRGPQGTLYGRNSIAGAINILSKRPTAAWGGEVRASYANFNHTTLQAVAGGSVTDTLGVRVGGSWEKQTEGYFDNVAGGPSEGGVIDQAYVEGQVEWRPTEDLEVWIKAASYSWNNGSGGSGGRASAFTGPYDYAAVPIGYLSPGIAAGYLQPGHVTLGPATNPAMTDRRAFNTNSPDTVSLNNNLIIAANVTYQLPGMELKYIGGYDRYEYQHLKDFDGTSLVSYQRPCTPAAPGCTGPLAIDGSIIEDYSENKRWYSHELNLASTSAGPLQWIVGAYYYQERYHQPLRIGAPGQMQVRTPVNAAPEPTGMVYYVDYRMGMKSQAMFGQIDWSFSDTLKTTLGLRYTHDKKDGTEFARLICFDICAAGIAFDITELATDSGLGVAGVSALRSIDPATGIASRGLAASWNATTGTAGLEWTPDPDLLVYGRYSRGYKAGGFNAGSLNAAPLTKPEHVDAFEIGAKKSFGRALQVNASIFYYDYTEAQAPVTVNPPTGPSMSVFYNIPKIRNAGVELETIWVPLDRLQIMFNYAYLDAEIREACCIIDVADPLAVQPGAQPSGPLTPSGQGQDLRGNKMPQSAKNKLALNATYTVDLAGGALALSGSYLWRDAQYGSIFTREYNRAPSWSQVDLRATWSDAEDRYRVVGFVRNLFDTEGYDGGTIAAANTAGVIGRTYSLTPPRTYGVELQYRF